MQLIDDGGLSTSNVSTDGNDKHVVYQEDCMCERMSVGRSVGRCHGMETLLSLYKFHFKWKLCLRV